MIRSSLIEEARRSRVRTPRAATVSQNDPRRERRGFTLVELVIATPLVLIATSLIASTLMASSQRKTLNRDRALAASTLQEVLEHMRNEDFTRIFALYNNDPFDDPNGPGTAPGRFFAVDGLKPIPDPVTGVVPAHGMVGEILLPVLNTGGAIDVDLELREDIDLEELGMPRDLNGDSVIDDLDHSEDYHLLPVTGVIRWQSEVGPLEFRMHTLLADWSLQ